MRDKTPCSQPNQEDSDSSVDNWEPLFTPCRDIKNANGNWFFWSEIQWVIRQIEEP